MPKLFLGNLGNDCRERDIEKLFRDYGELRNINIKGQFGFLELDDKRDAEDAIRDINGQSFNGGSRIRVEFANQNDRGGDRDRRGGGDRRGDRYQDTRGRQVSDGRFKRTNYRLVVENISSKTSWQDLKDYMRKAGDISYTTVNRGKDGEGLVEFVDREGMEYALKELDDTKLDGRRIRLVEEKRSPSRSRSRSNRRGNRRSESKGRGNRRSESNGRGNRRSESKGRRSMDRRSQDKAKRQRSTTPDEKSRSRSGDRARSDSKRRNIERRSPEKTSKQTSKTPDQRSRSRSDDRVRNEKSRSRSGDGARSDSKQRNIERRSPEKTRRQASKTPDQRSRSRSDDRVRNDDKQRSYSKSPKSGNKSERE